MLFLRPAGLVAILSVLTWTESSSTWGKDFLLIFAEQSYANDELQKGNFFCIPTWNSSMEAMENLTLSHDDTVATELNFQADHVTVNTDAMLSGTELVDKTVRMSSPQSWSVYGFSEQKTTAGLFLIYPVSSLGTDYYVVTYALASSLNELVVLATERDTRVQLTLPDSEAIRTPADLHFLQTGTNVSVLLQENQAFQVQRTSDLSGTLVQSDKPVAVLAGNKRTKLPDIFSWSDHVVEMLPPIPAWGQHHVTYPTLDHQYPFTDIYRLIGCRPNTSIHIYSNESVDLFLKRAGEWKEVTLPSTLYHVIESDQPIMVVKFVMAEEVSDTRTTDHCMTVIVPTEQWHDSFAFRTVRYRHNHVYFVARSVDADQVLLDGGSLPAGRICSNFSALGQDFQGCRLDLGRNETHHLTTRDGARIGAYLYSHQSAYGVCTPIGQSFDFNNGYVGETTTEPMQDQHITTEVDPAVVLNRTAELLNQTRKSPRLCYCRCRPKVNGTNSSALTAIEEAQASASQIQMSLSVDRHNVSSHHRKKTSASDPRPSSAVFGVVGVGIIIGVVTILILLDSPKLIQDIGMCARYLQKVYKGGRKKEKKTPVVVDFDISTLFDAAVEDVTSAVALSPTTCEDETPSPLMEVDEEIEFTALNSIPN